jgi:hypothetical protein
MGHAKMLSRLPTGSSPANSEAAVAVDWRSTAELVGTLSTGWVWVLEVDAPLAEDPPEAELEDVLEAALAEGPAAEVNAELNCEVTRFNASLLAMLAKPVV